MRESEHAAQVVDHGLALLGIEMQQDLGIRAGAEDAAPSLEAVAQLPEVVDLAVEGDDVLAVGAEHRLRGCGGEIDDGEATVPEADAAVLGDPLTHAVGTARGHMIARAGELRPIDGVGRVVVGVDAVDATHRD